MTCRDALDFLADYLDGSLPWRQRMSFDVHLCLCRNCRNYLEGYRKTIQATREVLSPPANVPCEPLPEEMIQAILASRPHGPNVD